MALEPVHRIINKVSHWPPEKRRQYLILALQAEKANFRRRELSVALRDATTKALKSEIRRKP